MTFVAPNLACGEARGGRIPCHGAVTDEQRSHRPNSAQPGGRQVFFAQTSLLAPHRSTAGYARRSRLVWAKNPLPRTSSYLCLRPVDGTFRQQCHRGKFDQSSILDSDSNQHRTARRFESVRARGNKTKAVLARAPAALKPLRALQSEELAPVLHIHVLRIGDGGGRATDEGCHPFFKTGS